MTEKTISFKDENLLKVNIRNGLIGIVIGILISIFVSVFGKDIVSAKNCILNILFSLFISLSITNSVFVYERFLKPEKYSLWKFLVSYYGCNMIGMIIGTELAYLIVSLIFKVPYNLLGHLNDYKFNFVVVIIVGTAILLFQAQKVAMLDKLKLKELDIIKIRQLKTQAELQTLQSRINPHFLYNSLNAIASLIHADPDKAETMTLNLSRLFRYSINSSDESISTVRQEIEIVGTYIAIEKVRFGERIQFLINAEDSLLNDKIPRFLIQPLVENALKHGLNNKTESGLLEISICKKGTTMEISIADNGTAFPEELEMGYGLKSTYDKLNLIYEDNYQVQIFNQPQKQIKVLIPVNH